MRLDSMLQKTCARRASFMLAVAVAAAILVGLGLLFMRPGHTTARSEGSDPQTLSGHTASRPPEASASATPNPSPGTDPSRGAPAQVATSTPLPLLGRRIGLDAGHGPRGDLGAVVIDPRTGKLIMSEAEFNLDVAKRCRDILQARGASVVLTRETAKTFTEPWPVDANGDGIVGGPKDDLQERVDILNNFHSEVFLSIHANNAPYQKSLRGVQVFYCGTSDCPFSEQSRVLGNLVLEQLEQKLASTGYPVQSAHLHEDVWVDGLHLFLLGPTQPPTHVRATRMPGVLAESLYLTAPGEGAELKRDDVRQAIALAYADALQAYLTMTSGRR